MKILHVISSMDPRGGGPVEGIRNIGHELVRQGHSAEVVCLDSAAEPFHALYAGVVHGLGKSWGSYAYNRILVTWLKENSGNYDAVIVNGLWQYPGFGTWRALAGSRIPYFVFTHGMLDPWFKRSYPLKHLKKWMYWPWAEYRVLRDAKAVIFTCEEERLLAGQSFWLYRCQEEVISYGTSAPPADSFALTEHFFSLHPDLRGKRLMLYLSRIHKKKGCDILVEAFAAVAPTDPGLHLVMAGPDQTGWVAELKEQAERLGIAHRITWAGMLQGDDKWGAFYAADVFCLPSHQENFGIVVAEALACGKPVLISNKVNIWREIIASGAGIVRDDSVKGTIEGLQQWLAFTPDAKQAMGDSALQCFNANFRIDRVAASLIRVLKKHLAVD